MGSALKNPLPTSLEERLQLGYSSSHSRVRTGCQPKLPSRKPLGFLRRGRNDQELFIHDANNKRLKLTSWVVQIKLWVRCKVGNEGMNFGILKSWVPSHLFYLTVL